MREKWNNLLAIVLVLAIIYTLSLTIWTYNRISAIDESQIHTGKASGILSLCINQAPQISTSSCSQNGTQNATYYCVINATDNQTGILNVTTQAISVLRTFNSNTNLPFNITNGSTISFTPSNSDVGIYLFNITANDQSGCFNSNTTTNFSFNISNINDAPYLSTNITDVTFNDGETIFAFSLNNFFTDPDLDTLNYTVSGNSNTEVTIQSDSLVRIRSDSCGYDEVIIFTAFDSYNLTADSNAITITCNQDQTTSSGGSGGGSGGGGGGGSSSLCTAEYECYDYHMCNVTNQKIRKCVDIKGCRDEALITVACTYVPPKICNENWTCGDWEACLPEGIQFRTCNDKNICGTNKTMPSFSQQCDYIGTCEDGIKNCHDGTCEEAIDCGGSCNACQSIQVPYPFEDQKNKGIAWLTWLIIILLTSILTYHYFRKEISMAITKAAWFLIRKKKKQFLLSKEDQRKLMAQIEDVEKHLLASQTKEETFETFNKIQRIMQDYFIKAMLLQGELDSIKLAETLEKKKKRIIKILREVFLSMNNKMLECLKEQSLVTKQNGQLIIEEMRNIILQTSEFNRGEYPREIQELKLYDKDTFLEKMYKKIINAYIAMQFMEVDASQKIYLELLSDYEKISVSEEDIIFKDLRRLFDNITYVSGWMKK